MAAYLAETFVTLLAVIAVAVLVLYGARKLGIGRVHGPMHVVGRLPLDPRRSVYLVRVANQVLVLGVSEAGITRLGEVDPDSIKYEPDAGPARFADVLARLTGKQADKPKEPSGGVDD